MTGNIEFKGGRLPNNPSKPRLTLNEYLSSTPASSDKVDWFSKVSDWPMYKNDQIGDCTCAAVGHILEAATEYGQGSTVKLSDDDILKAYEDVAGYDPATGQNDNGAVMQDVLNYWRKTGFGGHKLTAFAELKVNDLNGLHAACELFGNLYLGINFPAFAMDQFNAGQPWDVQDANSELQGGHAINAGWYDKETGMWKVITWGKVQEMTKAFFDKYCVSSDTRVLTADLEWVPAGKLALGDKLFAFDESVGKGQHRRFRTAEVLDNTREIRDCVKIVFADGKEITCTPEHKFLVTAGDRHKRWVEAQNLRIGGRYASKVVKVVEPWEALDTYDAGYLSAALDGEGCLTVGFKKREDISSDVHDVRLTFSQKNNAMLNKVEGILAGMGYDYNKSKNGTCFNLSISGRTNILRLLGQIRPIRLFEYNDVMPESFGCIPSHKGGVEVVGREQVGPTEIIVLETSTHTFIAEGLANHNCEEAWVAVTPEWVSANKSPEDIDLATLGNDYQQLTGDANPFDVPAPTPVPSPTPEPTPASDPSVLQKLVDDVTAAVKRLEDFLEGSGN